MRVQGHEVHGVEVDSAGRCAHWHSDVDVVAILFPCCEEWYACHDCHKAVADHPPRRWPRTHRETRALLCGVCGVEIAIRDYQACGDTCPHCKTAFNPGCAKHSNLYFEP